ncbi:chromate transporter [Clostridium sp.]|uniref:chromate transporter n=1 Tax=Clostridium sp. TaxID=1506 RepID=UPI003F36209C
MKELFDLFITFCRIGGLTFGGGYAMLPMLQKEVVENRKWATEQEVLDYYAVGQCTPGVIAVNTATFIGYKTHGVMGAISATTGVVFPSLIIIMVIAAFIQNFADLAVVQYAFSGIRVAVAVLVVNAIIKLWKAGIKDIIGTIIFIVTFIISVAFNLSPVYVVIGGIFVGIFAKRERGLDK